MGMLDQADKAEQKGQGSTAEPLSRAPGQSLDIPSPSEEVDAPDAAHQLGARRYVLAGFFAAAIAVAYVAGQIVSSAWNGLAEAQWAVNRLPALTAMGEDSRGTWSVVVGGLIAAAAFVYTYRRDDIRQWVTDAAVELAKVTWPNKKEVTSGTIIVVVASLIATVYFALLDRFWGFVTDLVYRA